MNNLPSPIISIIVPVYNIKHYLPKCLDSIVSQTFTDFEVLMIDDGSTDGSGEICEQYSRKDKRFITIHQFNQGLSVSRNNGLQRTQGKYISFIDGDDYIHPQMLELLYKAIRQGHYDFSMVRYQSVGDGEQIVFQKNISPCLHELSKKEVICGLFGKSWEDTMYMACWNKLYDSRLLTDVRFTNIKPSEDLLFNVEVFGKVCKAIEVECNLYYYVQRGTSISHSMSERLIIDRINVSYACLKFLSSGSVEEAYCMTKLYKVLFSSRFRVRKEMYRRNVIKRIKEVHKQVCKQFLRSKHISVFYKILFMGFFYCPLLYKVFIGLTELKARKA